jgi:integrase
MGLGSASDIPLSRARELLRDHRRLRAEGIDPIDHRDSRRAIPPKPIVTFQQVAADYVKSHESKWKHQKHRDKWESYLRRHIFPTLGSMPVDAITPDDVFRTLNPIWTKIPSAAGQCRSMIEMVLSAAKARRLRSGDNPAEWRGNLQHLLPKRGKVKNHAAMAYSEVPGFVTQLRQRDSMASYALEFLILTATRASETLGAQWAEIDMTTATWTIPDSRMKSNREHKIPLSPSAMALLQRMAELRHGPLVFPGPNGTLNGTAMPKLMHGRMATSGTIHGFRSSFRTWAAEQTDAPHEVAEAALAHVIPNAVVRAYRRTTMFDKRRDLMQQWSDYLNSQ